MTWLSALIEGLLYVSFPGVALNITVRELRSDGFHPLYFCDASGGDMSFSPSLEHVFIGSSHIVSQKIPGWYIASRVVWEEALLPPGCCRKLRNCVFFVFLSRRKQAAKTRDHGYNPVKTNIAMENVPVVHKGTTSSKNRPRSIRFH